MRRRKNKSIITAVLILVFLTIIIPITAFAQSYSFSLPQQYIDVYWNEDGTSSIDYVFEFSNDPSGPPIEYVDVGVPNESYDLGSVAAFANGVEVSDIEKSPYVTPGVAVGLGSHSIPPGGTGEVRVFIARVWDVLYPDDLDENYVSAVFSPNYFGSDQVHGTTDTILTYHLPPGVQPDEPRWHDSPPGFSSQPEAGIDQDGRITYTWRRSDANPSAQYQFGASFPIDYVNAGAVVKEGAASPVSGVVGGLSAFIIPLLCLGGIAGLIVWGVTADRRRKLSYLPPKIAIEGHGIKRGLTAVEAAILMEQPMDKILTMILFGVLKKNAAQVIKRDPLEIKLSDPLPDKLYTYEEDFLQAFQEEKKRARSKALQKMMIDLVKSVGNKMKGFSRKETVAYYQDITKRAWDQVEAADTPEVKSQKFDENMEWTMLDRDYDDRTRKVFRTGPVFVPIWWPRYDPGFGRAATTTSRPSVPSTTGRTGPSMPTLPGSAFAASVVGGVQNFSSKVVGNITDFTRGITNITNPPPKPPASSYSKGIGGGRSGGGGCACACACACAGCACACAGGGR